MPASDAEYDVVAPIPDIPQIWQVPMPLGMTD
jgi:hypothetical protein